MASCSTKADEVSLKLVNKELTYNFNLDSLDRFSYENDQQRSVSTNLVKFRLTNNTEKKYLFLTRDKRLNNITGIKVNVYEGDTLFTDSAPLITPFIKEQEREKIDAYLDYSFYLYQKEAGDNLKLGNQHENGLYVSYLFQSVVIHPGETQTITSLLSLPYVRENELLKTLGPIYYSFKPNKKYTFSLTYQIDAKALKSELSPEKLKELEENGIEIFEGKLETARIPIVNLFKSK